MPTGGALQRLAEALPLVLLLLMVPAGSFAAQATPQESQLVVERCEAQLRQCERSRAQGGGSVCGSDNNTYHTLCLLEQAACKGDNVTLLHRGRCKHARLCWSDREFALGLSRAPQTPAPFVPRCEPDGTYARVQCHDATGYCWCVTPAGRLLPGTTQPKERPPRCDGGHGKRATRTPPPKKGCAHNDRSKFSHNLIKNFRIEYNRLPQSSPTATKAEVLDWKFSTLDGDGDALLSREESASLRRLIRGSVRPRRCAKQFARLCDRDRDGRISRNEWHACIDLDVSQNTVEGRRVRVVHEVLFVDPPSPDIVVDPLNRRNSQPEANDCLSDRRSVLEEQKAGSDKLYVPECTPDGRFQKIQCYNSTGYCWCVHEDSGKPIPGTPVKDQIPKCDAVPAPRRPMNGCSEPRKQLFLKELMDMMSKKMISARNRTSQESQSRPLLPSSPEEEIAVWNFNALDKNKSKVLERKEWKHFRTMVTANKLLRKCGKRFPRYCDINLDRKISLTEWLNCLSSSEESISRTSQTSSFRRVKGENPLQMLLKQE
ncbi:SPARC-related modular calcium-binding protein 1 isoform X2 [Schistocerca americana]|uniref:SPARC-related modular calcium-binding protein 1 isoform X2 n=1 Tax=Schistocerca americana TaxID=7009 RepID=UPI001F4FBB23|nr:SPARC-related modular calcium-binding protein 1 isoform X2 [Schistocerca americana]XP_049960996.1 SPARC-related modular calcium-binding protein 1 isoform X1 [Schistocerca serialis cubense]